MRGGKRCALRTAPANTSGRRPAGSLDFMLGQIRNKPNIARAYLGGTPDNGYAVTGGIVALIAAIVVAALLVMGRRLRLQLCGSGHDAGNICRTSGQS